ncbi:HTH_Tnp_Tc3_2 domain-containing protein [Trichonephila clavipes]|nr:HTH_Tnp_Tc3_2 domain-containing protein [Trichonephila clavipes]
MSFTRRPGPGHPRQTSRREDRHIVKNARVQPTASLAAIQAQVAHSLGPPVSSRIIRRRQTEGHLGSRCPLRVLPFTSTHRRRKGTRSSLATNPDSISCSCVETPW